MKADGYGHGAVGTARAALGRRGRRRLAVALHRGGRRAAGGRHRRARPPALRATAADARRRWSRARPGTRRLHRGRHRRAGRSRRRAATSPCRSTSRSTPACTGSGADPADATRLAKEIAADGRLRLASVWTHLAVADEPDDPFTGEQLDRYREVLAALDAGRHRRAAAPRRELGRRHRPSRRPLRHGPRAASPCTASPPSAALAGAVDLQPALRLVSSVSHVKVVEAGSTVSYGRRYRVERPSVIATVPLGYADGVRRSLSAAGGEVLIGGAPPADRGNGDDGPAHGRLRRRRDRRGRRRGRAHRPSGRRRGDRRRVGRAPRHDRLRDRVRHRPAGAPPLDRSRRR